MKNTTNENIILWSDGQYKELILTFADGTIITNEDISIESMSLKKTLCDETELKFGKCSANEFRVRVLDTSKSYKGLKFIAQITCNGNTENLGMFTVYSDMRTSDKQYKDIIAYDGLFEISNTDVSDWYNNIVFVPDNKTVSLKDFRDSFFDYFGIEQEVIVLPFDDLEIKKNIIATTISGLDIIEMICQLNACFGTITENGKFKYVFLLKNEYNNMNTLEPSMYELGGFSYDDFVTQEITMVEIRNSSESFGGAYGTEGNNLVIEENLLISDKSEEELNEIAQQIYGLVQNISYTPSSLKLPFQYQLELGDFVRVVCTNGEIVEFPILTLGIEGISALNEVIGANGSESYSSNVNSISRSFIDLNGKYAKLSSTVDELALEIGKSVTPNVGGRNLLLGSKDLYGKVIFSDYLSLNGTILIDGKDTLVV